MSGMLRRLAKDEAGQDVIEYVLILSIVSLSCYLAVIAFGEAVNGLWEIALAKVIDATARILGQV